MGFDFFVTSHPTFLCNTHTLPLPRHCNTHCSNPAFSPLLSYLPRHPVSGQVSWVRNSSSHATIPLPCSKHKLEGALFSALLHIATFLHNYCRHHTLPVPGPCLSCPKGRPQGDWVAFVQCLSTANQGLLGPFLHLVGALVGANQPCT